MNIKQHKFSISFLLAFIFSILTTPVLAGKNVAWEILIDLNDPQHFFANIGTEINSDTFAPFVPGSTYWLSGTLYPAGSVDSATFQVDQSKKIGEWHCTGTRVSDINVLQAPADNGRITEEANFTFRLNNGGVIYTKQQFIFIDGVQDISKAYVIFSNVPGTKANKVMISDNVEIFLSPDFSQVLYRGIEPRTKRKK